MEFSDWEFSFSPPQLHLCPSQFPPAHSAFNSAHFKTLPQSRVFLQNRKKWQFFSFLSCLLFLRMGGWSIERLAKTYTSHSPVKLWILSESPKEVLSHINTVLNCSVFICYQIYAFGMLHKLVLDKNTCCRYSKKITSFQERFTTITSSMTGGLPW